MSRFTIHTLDMEKNFLLSPDAESIFLSESDVQTTECSHTIFTLNLVLKILPERTARTCASSHFQDNDFVQPSLITARGTECCDTAEKLIVPFPFKRTLKAAEELDSRLLQMLPAGKKPGDGAEQGCASLAAQGERTQARTVTQSLPLKDHSDVLLTLTGGDGVLCNAFYSTICALSTVFCFIFTFMLTVVL